MNYKCKLAITYAWTTSYTHACYLLLLFTIKSLIVSGARSRTNLTSVDKASHFCARISKCLKYYRGAIKLRDTRARTRVFRGKQEG